MGYQNLNLSTIPLFKYRKIKLGNFLKLPLLVIAILLSFNLKAALFNPNEQTADDTQMMYKDPSSDFSLLELEKNVDLLGDFKSFEGFDNQAVGLAKKGLEYLKLGKKAEGLKLLKQAWKLDQTVLEIAVKIALIHIQDKHYKEAIDYINQFQSGAPNDPLGYKLGGLAYSGLGDNEKSKKAFEKAIELQPGAPDASLGLVILALNQKKIDEGIKILEKSLVYYPGNQRTLLLLAQIESQTNKSDKAINRLKEAINSDPKTYLPRFYLIRILLLKGDIQKSLNLINEALTIFPDDVSLQELKGLALLKKQSSQKALDLFRDLIKKAPEEISVYYNLAQAHEQLNQYKEALNALNLALKADPNNMPSKFMKAKLLAKTGKLDLAAQNLQELNQTVPNNVEILHLLAKTTLVLNRISDSMNYYEKALNIESNNILSIEYAYVLMRANQLPKSFQVLETWIKNNPSDTLVKNSLADLYLAKNQNDRAQELYANILIDQPQNPGVHNNLAWILSSKGLNKDALIHARKALELLPNNPLVMDTNASILLELGDLEKAMILINNALKKAPDNQLLHFHRAKALVKMGDNRQARKVLEKVIKANDFDEIKQAKELLNEIKINP